MNVSRKTTFAAGAVMALVITGSTAYAATGGDFVLGKSNKARTTTSLTNSGGPALMLKSKAGTPPLKVNEDTKVPRLNADRVDGRSEQAFALAAGGFGTMSATGIGTGDADSNGIPEIIGATATCPDGTNRTGGGFMDFTAGGTTFYSGPTGPRSWTVAVETDNQTGADIDVTAEVICYNPRGEVAETNVRTTRSDFLKQLSPAVERQLAARS